MDTASLVLFLLVNGFGLTLCSNWEPFILMEARSPNCSEKNCQPCQNGTFANQTVPLCKCCPKPGFCMETGNFCTPCSEGHFQPNSTEIECVPCPTGQHQPKKGQSVCLNCGAGTETRLPGQADCTPCLPGHFKFNESSLLCQNCSSGSFNNESGATECALCPFGTYADHDGSLNCTFCGPGNHSNTTGASQCSECPPGSYSNDTGAVNCFPCWPGTAQGIAGQPGCIECRPKTICTREGCTSCGNCPGGQEGAEDRIKCVDCTAGTFKLDNLTAGCIPCSDGYYTDQPRQRECMKCPQDFKCRNGKKEACEPLEYCPPGTSDPKLCDSPWYTKTSDGCHYSSAFIVIMCIVTIVPTLLAIVLIVCHRHGRQQLHVEVSSSGFSNERTPLLNTSLSSQEPQYTGL